MPSSSQIDFGYPWWLSYGHVPLLIAAAALLFWGIRRRWSKVWIALLGLMLAWSFAGFLITRLAFNVNGLGSLPTQNFLRSGMGRVLDVGAGTGRSSIMVLEARPQATLVALDLFGDSFRRHFGEQGTPQERLTANLKAAGVEQRATITTADMRHLPFEPASFDAVISAYAIDHLGREGILETLTEVSRVVRPGGDFLLMVIAKEPWVQLAFGPLLMHGGPRNADWWTQRVRDAGFAVREWGTKPATLYVLSTRPVGTSAAAANPVR